MMLKAAVVFFLSCIAGCLTIRALLSNIIGCGVRLMLSTLDGGLTVVRYICLFTVA